MWWMLCCTAQPPFQDGRTHSPAAECAFRDYPQLTALSRDCHDWRKLSCPQSHLSEVACIQWLIQLGNTRPSPFIAIWDRSVGVAEAFVGAAFFTQSAPFHKKPSQEYALTNFLHANLRICLPRNLARMHPVRVSILEEDIGWVLETKSETGKQRVCVIHSTDHHKWRPRELKDSAQMFCKLSLF